jgi:thiamine-monophosphate kinase
VKKWTLNSSPLDAVRELRQDMKRAEKKDSTRLNEEQVIEAIWKILSSLRTKRLLPLPQTHRKSADPFSDDVVWIKEDRKKIERFIVAKADMIVSSTDVPRQMSPRQISFKAVTSCVSDFAAKGVKPSFGIVSIALSRVSSTRGFVRGLARGLKNACLAYGICILGGDTNESRDETVIDFCLFGFADRIVRRDGARVGDLVAVSGPFGLQASGLKILVEGDSTRLVSSNSFRRRAVASVLNPVARLEVGLEVSKYLTSSIDSSDGLALSLYQLAEASKVCFELDHIPIASGVEKFAKDNFLDPLDLALFGGEEYELVCTFNESQRKLMESKGFTVIGRVSEGAVRKMPLVKYEDKVVPRKGWIHLTGCS